VSRAWPWRGPLLRVAQRPRQPRPARGVWCRPGCDQHPHSSQPRTRGQEASPFISRTATPRPRNASICPLATGGLIGVRFHVATGCPNG